MASISCSSSYWKLLKIHVTSRTLHKSPYAWLTIMFFSSYKQVVRRIEIQGKDFYIPALVFYAESDFINSSYQCPPFPSHYSSIEDLNYFSHVLTSLVGWTVFTFLVWDSTAKIGYQDSYLPQSLPELTTMHSSILWRIFWAEQDSDPRGQYGFLGLAVTVQPTPLPCPIQCITDHLAYIAHRLKPYLNLKIILIICMYSTIHCFRSGYLVIYLLDFIRWIANKNMYLTSRCVHFAFSHKTRKYHVHHAKIQ